LCRRLGMRRCTRCPFRGPDSAFAIKIKSKANNTGVCKPCKATYNASWYERNKAKHVQNVHANNKRYREEYRAELDKLKDAPCVDCGERFPPCVMDFDHIDPSSKKFSLANAPVGLSWELVLSEVAKCDLVCANCHRIRTFLTRPRSLVDQATVS
jgi:hypothetical protein